MNYAFVLEELEKASLFELFRLQSAINHLLDDPARLLAIKQQMRPGMDITMPIRLAPKRTKCSMTAILLGIEPTTDFTLESEIRPHIVALGGNRIGMDITYFDSQLTRLVPARLETIRKTRASVRDLETGKLWTIPLCMINIEGSATDIQPRSKGVDRLSLRVGDRVGYVSRAGEEVFGTVIKLNPKRAQVETGQGTWNVPYTMLFTVLEGEQGQEQHLLPR